MFLILLSFLCVSQIYRDAGTHEFVDDSPFIFIVTPTYPRPTQLADMTRLCNTLRYIPRIYWVVVDDSSVKNAKLRELLEFCSVPFIYLYAKTPKNLLNGKKFGRGVHNRNAALAWIRKKSESVSGGRPSILYFADDDNAYDVRLFDEIRKTKKVSMFPVGCVAKTGVSTPIIHRNGSLLGYHDPFYAKRVYPVDMAGFAIRTDLILHSTVLFEHKTGYLEDHFLRSLNFDDEEIECLAQKCTQILVWHVKTLPASPILRAKVNKTLQPLIKETNLLKLFENYS